MATYFDQCSYIYYIFSPKKKRDFHLTNFYFVHPDRGPGLKPEAAQHIFDRFYRTDKGRSRAAGGSGLGLPIVQQILLAHHGTARVETAPGAGCNFILELPPG